MSVGSRYHVDELGGLFKSQSVSVSQIVGIYVAEEVCSFFIRNTGLKHSELQARGRAEVHPSQSGEARTGGVPGTVAVEQLSFLSVR